MKRTSIRITAVAAVAVLSVLGLSQAPADAGAGVSSRTTYCCG